MTCERTWKPGSCIYIDFFIKVVAWMHVSEPGDDALSRWPTCTDQSDMLVSLRTCRIWAFRVQPLHQPLGEKGPLPETKAERGRNGQRLCTTMNRCVLQGNMHVFCCSMFSRMRQNKAVQVLDQAYGTAGSHVWFSPFAFRASVSGSWF